MLLELQQSGKRSAVALAEQLEVSVRTIYRDVDALSAAGVPIYSERGSRGGIVLADRYRDALSRFGDDEVRALFVSSDDALADIGLTGDRRSALDKLTRAMPARTRAALDRMRGRVHVDSRRWMGVTAPAAPLTALREAVWADRCVSIAYSDRTGKVTRRVVEPLGLVTKAGVWYLVARDDRAVKTFRVQRIARVRVLERRFARPSGFDVGAYWQGVAAHVAAEEEPYRATFRMTRRALANAEIYFTVESRTRLRGSTPAAWLVRIAFSSFMSALQEAMSWGGDAVAVDPPHLCEALAERGHMLLERYGAERASQRP
jgi:predicted DNA-binding transcriptional regulator YafY